MNTYVNVGFGKHSYFDSHLPTVWALCVCTALRSGSACWEAHQKLPLFEWVEGSLAWSRQLIYYLLLRK